MCHLWKEHCCSCNVTLVAGTLCCSCNETLVTGTLCCSCNVTLVTGTQCCSCNVTLVTGTLLFRYNATLATGTLCCSCNVIFVKGTVYCTCRATLVQRTLTCSSRVNTESHWANASPVVPDHEKTFLHSHNYENVLACIQTKGVLPIMAYMGRFRLKGVPFSGFKYMKG